MGHTPGPWIVDEDYEDELQRSIPIVGTHDDGYIAGIHAIQPHDYTFTKEDRANARLIAAAPDLLAALEQASREYMMLYAEAMARDRNITRIVDMVHTATDAMTAAIAKAKGAL